MTKSETPSTYDFKERLGSSHVVITKEQYDEIKDSLAWLKFLHDTLIDYGVEDLNKIRENFLQSRD